MNPSENNKWNEGRSPSASEQSPSESNNHTNSEEEERDADEELEWEEWKPGEISFQHHMVAGSIAGLAEHVSLFPVDTIKTHVQCQKCGNISPFQTWAYTLRMIHSEGIFRLWRGVTAMFAGCIPAHAAYFSIFESMKVALKANSKDEHQPLRAALCGAIATTSHDFFMNPFDMIKQRMQLGYYRSISHCISTIAKNEGILSFYVSFPTTLLMNIPYGAIVVAVNESAKKVLNPSGQYNLSASLLAGSIAGGVAAAFTTPLDVIKTRIQTQEMVPCIDRSTVLNNNLSVAGCIEKRTHAPSSSTTSASAGGVNASVGGTPLNQAPRANFYTSAASTHDPFMRGEGRHKVNGLSFLTEGYSAFIGVTKRLIKEEGLMGFWRGVVPRVMTQAPAVAISWTAYESVKATFGWQLGFMSHEKREK